MATPLSPVTLRRHSTAKAGGPSSRTLLLLLAVLGTASLLRLHQQRALEELDPPAVVRQSREGRSSRHGRSERERGGRPSRAERRAERGGRQPAVPMRPDAVPAAKKPEPPPAQEAQALVEENLGDGEIEVETVAVSERCASPFHRAACASWRRHAKRRHNTTALRARCRRFRRRRRRIQWMSTPGAAMMGWMGRRVGILVATGVGAGRPRGAASVGLTPAGAPRRPC